MRRILLKLSGEALAGDKHMGFDEETVRGVALQVKKLVDEGYEIGIVTGGGNFWRGRSSENIDRTKADQIGMLATVMNCIYVSEIFRSVGMQTEVLTPFSSLKAFWNHSDIKYHSLLAKSLQPQQQVLQMVLFQLHQFHKSPDDLHILFQKKTSHTFFLSQALIFLTSWLLVLLSLS